MYKENDIFYEDNEYGDRAIWCNETNTYHIEEIEPDEVGRRFKIVKNPEPTEEQILDEIRSRREVECFSVINRGQLWYNMLTNEQIEELNVWYHNWLDVTQTKIIPEKPSWLK